MRNMRVSIFWAGNIGRGLAGMVFAEKTNDRGVARNADLAYENSLFFPIPET